MLMRLFSQGETFPQHNNELQSVVILMPTQIEVYK